MSVCSFFGHRNISERERAIKVVAECVETLIVGFGYREFLFGGYGDFDFLCLEAVNGLKEKFPYIKTTYVQAYYRPHDKTNILILKSRYDDIIYPNIENVPKKLAIIHRNYEMIKMSNFCIFYIQHSWGGANLAYEYAKKNQKQFVNLAPNNI